MHEQPQLDYPDYRSTELRHPKQPLVYLPEQLTEMTGSALGILRPGAIENDLTKQQDGEPVGERITDSRRLLDQDGRPIRDSRVEIGFDIRLQGSAEQETVFFDV
jgi:protocatechuate 3,4-dioxygenase beta subunit